MTDSLINLKNKTAIVTGGAMGIGYGIAYRLAEAGANVVIADLNEEVGHKTAGELIAKGFKAVFIKTNVAVEEEAQQATDFALKTPQIETIQKKFREKIPMICFLYGSASFLFMLWWLINGAWCNGNIHDFYPAPKPRDVV